MSLSISNRRYIGSKKKLLDDIFKVVKSHYNKYDNLIFADLFAGTGVVSESALRRGLNVIINDNLYCNYVAYKAWLGEESADIKKIKKIVSRFNGVDVNELDSNYFSKIYGGKYFSKKAARKIGYLREEISDLNLKKRERYILLASLMYATDKIANTVGHYEHFLSKEPKHTDINLEVPEIKDYCGDATIYNTDANKLVRNIKCDVAYIDPPYNARQYVNFYHVLENLTRWEKPEKFEGKSMKFKRDHLKSEYSRAKAPIVFKDLIDNLDAKLIIVSYNNTYSAKSSSSNNQIKEEKLLEILKLKGEVKKRAISHKAFNSGKTKFNNHKEFLYICKTTI